MLQIYNWKDGIRTAIGGALIAKHLIEKVVPFPIAVGPLDPADPEKKKRIKDVPDADKTHYLVLKFYTANPKQRPNYKGDEMEDIPFYQTWVPAHKGEEEYLHYARELGAK